jgi:hypothetical protein
MEFMVRVAAQKYSNVDVVEAVNLLAENHLVKALNLYENPIRWRENRYKMDII